MNILEPLEMVLITPPRMGTRALSDFLIREGKIVEYAKIDNPNFVGAKTGTTLFHTFPNCLRKSTKLFDVNEEQVKRELAPLFRERYSYYTWVSTIRHPVGRYASLISWQLSLNDKKAEETAKAWMQQPQSLNIMEEYDSLLNIDKIVNIDYWIRTEHMAEDISNIPCLNNEKILKKNNSLAHKAFERSIKNNYYASSKNKTYFSLNDIPRKTWNYFYFKYREIYDKFGYDKYQIKEVQPLHSQPSHQKQSLLHHS